MHLFENYSLKTLNTFHIDVFAKFFLSIDNAQDIKQFITDKAYQNENRLILGGGSNLLFQNDFDGVVLKNNLKGIELIDEDPDYVFVKFASGENWHESVLYGLDKNWYGLENLSLIPGTMGAAPIQNIGAYGVELKDVFHELSALQLDSLKEKKYSRENCDFGYRHSIFKTLLKNKVFILSVTLKLKKEPDINISYKGISEYLRKKDIQKITPKDVSDAVITVRKNKLPDPEVIGNGGSFFKNPVISKNLFEKLKEKHTELPHYKENEGRCKIPAAYLIQECGWKGFRSADAGVHAIQPLVLVNYGSATGQELVELSKEIRKSVFDKFQIKLEPEVNII